MTIKEKNYFETLNLIECKTEKKNSLTYISWSDAWLEVKKLHPNANYTIYEDQNGFPFWESKFGIDVKVGVSIEGIEHIIRLPVMDGANRSLTSEKQTLITLKNVWKDGKQVYENGKAKKEENKVTIEAATSFDINKTIMRAFAKAIAMHGLGLYVFRGEDLPEDDPLEKEKKEKELKDKELKDQEEKEKKVKEQQELYTSFYEKLQACKSLDELKTTYSELSKLKFLKSQSDQLLQLKDDMKKSFEK